MNAFSVRFCSTLWSKNSSRSPPSKNSLLIAQRPLKIKQVREVFCQGRFPASLIYAIYALRAHRPLSRRLPLVILQQAAQSFSTPHCSHLPCSFLPASAKETRSDCLRSEEHTSELQSRLHLVCRL